MYDASGPGCPSAAVRPIAGTERVLSFGRLLLVQIGQRRPQCFDDVGPTQSVSIDLGMANETAQRDLNREVSSSLLIDDIGPEGG